MFSVLEFVSGFFFELAVALLIASNFLPNISNLTLLNMINIVSLQLHLIIPVSVVSLILVYVCLLLLLSTRDRICKITSRNNLMPSFSREHTKQ